MHPTPAQCELLTALQAGARLRLERTLDGAKVCRIYTPAAPAGAAVPGALVQGLEQAGWIESNMKFPAATFMLTDAGIRLATQLTGSAAKPVGPRLGA